MFSKSTSSGLSWSARRAMRREIVASGLVSVIPQPWIISTPSFSQNQRINETGGADPPQVTRSSFGNFQRSGSFKIRGALNAVFSLAPEPEVESLFSDCDPGAVPCTGTAYGIETVVDEALTSLAFVYFESDDHEHLVRVSDKDFHKIMGGLRHGHFSHQE